MTITYKVAGKTFLNESPEAFALDLNTYLNSLAVSTHYWIDIEKTALGREVVVVYA